LKIRNDRDIDAVKIFLEKTKKVSVDDTNVKKCEKSANVCKNVEKFYTPYMNILNIKMIMVKLFG